MHSLEPLLPTSVASAILDYSLCSPRIKISRTTTASELLAAFSPKPHPPKVAHSQLLAPSQRFTITMTAKRGLRRKERISYTISDDSEAEGSPSAVSSAFSSPQKIGRVRKIIDLDEEDEFEEIELAKTPPPRTSSAGHSLRQLRAPENRETPRAKRRKLSKGAAKKYPLVCSDIPVVLPRSARNEIRENIATETAGKRAKFFVAKKDFFLPLLPESNNYVKKLVEQHHQRNETEDTSIIPYEALTKQPDG